LAYRCEVAEEEWEEEEAAAADPWVENRFTVGSLVWAQLQGWPAWPAMVDDSPETGTGTPSHRWKFLLGSELAEQEPQRDTVAVAPEWGVSKIA
jgi:hypothetical protein